MNILRICKHAGSRWWPAEWAGAMIVIMHNVTTGLSHSRRGKQGVPVIGSRVFIRPNAVRYGGSRVGDDALIGANRVVNKDVPTGALAVGVPAVITLSEGMSQP